MHDLQSMSLAEFNSTSDEQALRLVMHWCAAPDWARDVCARRPYANRAELKAHTSALWQATSDADRLAAFAAHPAIGDVELLRSKFAPQANAEQGQVLEASAEVIASLATQNLAYRERHGFTFIVFATGKSAQQMLELLNARIDNTRAQEISNAAAEQLKIMQLRLQQTLTETQAD